MSRERPAGGAELSRFHIFAYAIAAFSTQLIAQPINIYLPQVYAKEMGVGLAALGVGLMVTQVAEALSQQVCGFLSDRTRTRWGARKPWVAGGATFAIIAAFFLLKPPPGVGLAWFMVWKIIYDFSWAAKNVAYTAWGAELSSDYRQRIRVLGASSFMSQAGYVSNEMLPIIVFALGLTASSTYSMSMMGYYFLVGAITIPCFHAITLIFTPSVSRTLTERPSLRNTLKSLRANKPFLRYILAFGIYGLGVGGVSLSFTFYDGYLKVGNAFPWLMTLYSAATLGSIPAWIWIINRLGKHRSYAIGVTIGACLAPLGWLTVNPDTMTHAEVIAHAVVILSIMGLGVGCSATASTSILGDVADYGELKSGERRTAGYFAFYLLVSKLAIAVGSSLAFEIVAAFGYNAAAHAVNSPTAKHALLSVYAIIPAILSFTAACLMWNFPIDARRHAIIRRRLADRALRP